MLLGLEYMESKKDCLHLFLESPYLRNNNFPVNPSAVQKLKLRSYAKIAIQLQKLTVFNKVDNS